MVLSKLTAQSIFGCEPWVDAENLLVMTDNTSGIILAKNKLPPSDMPGVAWQPHSFFNGKHAHPILT